MDVKQIEAFVETLSEFQRIGLDIGGLVTRKNQAYGNSFANTAEFLKLLYPNGIKPEQYTDLGLIFRIFDKLMRIASNPGAFDENPYHDLVGYSILGAASHKPTKEDQTKSPQDDNEYVAINSMTYLVFEDFLKKNTDLSPLTAAEMEIIAKKEDKIYPGTRYWVYNNNHLLDHQYIVFTEDKTLSETKCTLNSTGLYCAAVFKKVKA